jgi:hypothetical protein
MMMSSERPTASAFREAEDPGCAPVPHADHALSVCIYDRIRHAGNETFGEMGWVKLHDLPDA